MWIVFLLLHPIFARAAVVSLPLTRVGYHFMMQMYAGGSNVTTIPKILVDFGSTAVVLLQDAVPGDVIVDNSTVHGVDVLPFSSDNAPYSYVETIPATLNLSVLSSSGFSSVNVITALLIEPLSLNALNAGIHYANGMLGLRGGLGPVILANAFGLLSASTHLVYALISDPAWSSTSSATLVVYATSSDVPSGNVQWSEPWLSANLSSGLAFTAYRVGVCGVETALNATSNVIVTVNTSSTCLTLPGEMFDAAVAWLPVRCSKTAQYTVTGSPVCVLALPSNTTVNELQPMPLVSFQLRLDGQTVSIDLRSLLLTTNGSDVANGMPVCMLRGRTLSIANRIMAPSASTVVLGTMALQGLEVLVDLGKQRVGFRLPTAAPAVNTSICQPKAVCTGQQSYYVPGNTCLPPQCRQYIFKQLDSASQTCAFTTGFRTFSLFMVCFGVVMETVAIVWRRKLDSAVQQTRERMSGDQSDDDSPHRRDLQQFRSSVEMVGSLNRHRSRRARRG